MMQAADGVPIVRLGGQWIVPRDRLIEDVATDGQRQPVTLAWPPTAS